MRVYGYVVMPEHVHLLVSEPERATLADALKSMKQGVSRRLIGIRKGAAFNNQNTGGPLKPDVGLSGEVKDHFWQKRYYDFNVRNHHQFVESSATYIATRSKPGCASIPGTGDGAASTITPRAVKDA